jgi:hypothetical protein
MSSHILDINNILKTFPKFELSYETMIHKNVYNSDIILAIPDGDKYFAWFTCYNNIKSCFMIKLNEKSSIIDVKQITTSFDEELCLSCGTIFYGTVFKYNNNSCFCIEDIYFYKGKSAINMLYFDKIKILQKILDHEMSQIALSNNHFIFGLPLMSVNFNILLQEIQTLPYKISQIKYRFFNNNNCRKILCMNYYKPGIYKTEIHHSDKNKNKNKNLTRAVFKITADIEPDIYNLFVNNNGVEEYYDTAFIPDYKTSVKMNQLFRKIKENDNLDAIEESDDEEEFENSKEDKFVYLDKSFNMHCEYNHKFKRWCPISLSGKNDNIISLNLIN